MQNLDNFVPITHAKSKLLDIIRLIHDRDVTYAITKNGVPEAVLISMKKFEGLLETIEILADQDAVAQLRGSADDVVKDRFVGVDEVL